MRSTKRGQDREEQGWDPASQAKGRGAHCPEVSGQDHPTEGTAGTAALRQDEHSAFWDYEGVVWGLGS